MNAHIFVIEGPDGAGKTTFVERMIARDMNHVPALRPPRPRYIHNGSDDALLSGSLYRHYRAQLLDAVSFRDGAGVSTYIDRSFLSEVVYGGVYRGASRITPRQLRKLEKLAKRKGIVLLGMSAAEPTRRERLAERGEEWDLNQVYVGGVYDEYFQSHSDSWITASSVLASTEN